MRSDAVLTLLHTQQVARVDPLHAVHPDPAERELTMKRQLDHAVACLRLCEQHQIHPDARVHVLPWPGTHFGGVVLTEVDEADQPLDTPVAATDGTELHLNAGDLVLQQDPVFALPALARAEGDPR
ncbi:hypothetical protein [Comamonas serinivorans]|nr:hypothetical protein [Comamonas serinivorans]